MYERCGFGLSRVQQRGRDANRHVRVDQADTLPEADFGYAFLPESAAKGMRITIMILESSGPNRILAMESLDNVSSIHVLRESQ